MNTARMCARAITVFIVGLAGVATAQPVLFTGDAEADFGPGSLVVLDPGEVDVGVPLAFPAGTISGNDIKDLRLSYDEVADVMYVGFNMYRIATDVDSQAGPDVTGPALAGLGGTDVPRVGGTESFALVVDVDEDGTIDVIIGVSGTTDIDGFMAASFAGSPFAPGFAFGAPLPPHTGAVVGTPSALLPDLEFTVPNWSALPTSSGGDLSAQFSINAFVGSFSDAGIGEDFTPGAAQFTPICFPQPERCNDFDDDCDGEIDEGFDAGAVCHVGVGNCAANGVQVCLPDGTMECSATPSDPLPEACNAIDDDCDGSTDEGIGGGVCTSDLPGVCANGQVTCEAGVIGCAPIVQPGVESCDNTDDDCDGSTDEGFVIGEACQVGVGACRVGGVTLCAEDGGIRCSGTPSSPNPETCDAVDNDCDGQSDEGYNLGDACAAGVGACEANGVIACDGNGGSACGAIPGDPAVEACNGVDDDCDGSVDEGTGGNACNTGVAGVCANGTNACLNGAIVCQGENQPGAEVCDGADNDCDGQSDEGYAVGSACQTGLGACEANGVVICDGNGAANCSATQSDPNPEICDAIDNDCDGESDEDLGLGDGCNVGVGACAANGENVCDGNGGVTCNAQPGQGGAEVCNDADDDCDGETDENLGLAEVCSVGIGACQASGITVCGDDAVVCDAQPGQPQAEVCDGNDNDCDGQIDEELGLGAACETGVGECNSNGVNVCDGLGGVTCNATAESPKPEVCNGLDDDCDGSSDEKYGLGEACSAGVGACAANGEIACDGNGGSACNAEAGDPVAEMCDANDNDCDGTTDEGQGGDACDSGQPGACGPGTTVCANGALSCEAGNAPGVETCNNIDDDCDGSLDEGTGAGTACQAGVGACLANGVNVCDGEGGVECLATQSDPQPETCDGTDNDCDGTTDEGQGGDACDSGQPGACGPGTTVCANGALSCEAGNAPGVETCNNIDDDCDGSLDEGTGAGTACQAGVGACLANGVNVCDGEGGVECSATQSDPQPETCDGTDNDCDGTTDEGQGGDACDSGQPGACGPGTTVCANGALSCEAGNAPGVETCNNIDDDCDGSLDEGTGAGTACQAGVGACLANGVNVCDGEGGVECSATQSDPQPETCDAVDNDCDGTTDEGQGGDACDSGQPGACGPGTTVCANGALSCEAGNAPGVETCNNADDDCDGSTDEGIGLGDVCNVGQGACGAAGQTVCDANGGVVCNAQPGEPGVEVCDGADNDCDGNIDENLGLGALCNAGVGACAANGVNVCGDDGTVTCSATQGDPQPETCNNTDDDCDGSTDENLGLGDVCNVGQGACGATGENVCDAGAVVCNVQPGVPGAEVCDGADNDCDGQSDEGFDLDEVCTVGIGACQSSGITVCDGEGGVACDAQPGSPEAEVCDINDNDCDGNVDEGTGVGDACNAGVGACNVVGENVCDGLGGVTCNADPLEPKVETCDGADEDCDGSIDEGTGVGDACEVGVGLCAGNGVHVCDGEGGVACSATPSDPQPEACNGSDDDCDGNTDEGIAAEACNSGEPGVCGPGTTSCVNGATVCEPGNQPGAEVCDNIDNDCDGNIDEGTGAGDACQVGVGACMASGVNVCGDDGVVVCSATQPDPQPETCNGTDDDCDGTTDEGTGGDVCDSGEPGACGPGTTACVNGALSCAPGNQPGAEVCDNADNDCDGNIDEGTGAGDACQVGIGACMGNGVNVCAANGAVECSATQGEPQPETCNATDDDCDGTTDEGFGLGEACNEGVGACAAAGETVCDGNGGATCNADPGQPAAEACNGSDDDCDGSTDEGIAAEACNSGEPGVCGPGTTSCVNGATVCEPGNQPGAEVCDNIDNDCDGNIDEGTGAGDACQVGVGACMASGVNVCGDDGVVVCSATQPDPQPETCNGTDDDCDGTTDEGTGGDVCDSGEPGACGPGTTACVNGATVCEPGNQPGAEVCDNADNDCDGNIDEGTGAGEACQVGVGACMGNGVNVCAADGAVECSATQGDPQPETCNATDDDCDGTTDEGFNLGEACNEGVGACAAAGETVCDGNGGATCNADPGQPAAEACNGSDDDCDGNTDEGIAAEACNSGEPGVCGPGTTSCVNGATVCEPGNQPGAEVCDNIDNDCDGNIDEGTGAGDACQVGVGACMASGVNVCGDDGVVVCSATQPDPQPESCNAVDDDCDGTTDEGTGGDVCDSGEPGACGPGTTACVNGALSCAPGNQPGAEVCDNADNDCDGNIDEGTGAGEACQVGVGACMGNGVNVCAADGAVECSATQGDPQAEACNAVDDDCDGTTDEGTGGDACQSGQPGACGPGTVVCADGALSCDPNADPGAETCDGSDEDCDGNIDEGFGLGDACNEGVGACAAAGENTCDANGGVTCNANPGQPVAETCNGADDDCDGTTDEGTGGDACQSGQPGACGPGTTVCANGALSCEPGAEPGIETCDGSDEDCDGNTDEGFGLGDACNEGVGACAAAGENICDANGGVTCNANPGQPVAETCNGADDDCDGTTDEGTGGDACQSGQPGACGPGTTVCANGALSCEPGAEPGVETCDGSDEDCDGNTDEGFGLGDACNEGVGACAANGENICDANGGVTCNANPGQPIAETCNGADDDCDGSIDEGLGLGDVCAVGVGTCAADGELVCGNDGAVVCDAQPGAPADEICDGLDNDCDASTDEETGGDDCDSGRPGACGPGTTTCAAGQVQCDPTNEPGAETCDALDNDCDGTTDEGFGLGDECTEGQGTCADVGAIVCDGNGGAACNAEPGQPGAEICNAADDDCDGSVDEGFNVGDACQNGMGACAEPGQIICRDGDAVCDGEGGDPEMEICDGIDNDCDGDVDENSPVRQFAADEITAEGHALWIPNFYGNGELTLMQLNDGARFTMRSDGTASVTGNAVVIAGGIPGDTWAVNMNYEFRGRGPDFGGPHILRPDIQTPDLSDEWFYYDQLDATLTRGDLVADLTQMPADGRFPFQFGMAANDYTADLGAASWFTWVLTDNGQVVRNGTGDMNLKLDPLDVCEEICDIAGGDPEPETCNGNDDDCDGIVDEEQGVGAACIVGEGECAAEGEQACGMNGEIVCEAMPGDPAAETCDYLDNDCDGSTDEGFGLGDACNEGIGACAVDGEIACDVNGGVTCDAEPGAPVDEACDAIDNDCDGTTDEDLGLGEECMVGVGACGATGENVCGDNGAVTCNAEPGAPVDEVCDANDNDCDGTADEGFGLGEACSVGIGACTVDGLTSCDDNGGVTCDAAPGNPVAEVCDGIDNDCDGSTDEGLGLGDACTAGVGACGNDGENVCDGNGGVTCDAEPGAPVAEACNAIDDDCDGSADEGLGLGDACSEGVGACMVDGVNECGDDGAVTCSATPGNPVAESCDAIDNDCDGTTDEGLGLGDACNAGEGACAAEGEQVCDGNGGVICNAEPGNPGAEICNDADDDCDGNTDEGLGLGDECSAGEGECAETGHQVCGDDGQVTCDVEPGEPMAELCDGLDNDCDGATDEEGPRQVFAASAFLNGHAFWLPNLYQAGKLVRMKLRDGAQMVVADGVARLTGTAYIFRNSGGPGEIGEEWDVNIAFAFRGVGDAFGGPKTNRAEQTPEVTADWIYYDMIVGDAVMRRGNTELRLTQMPADGRYPFQVGNWANMMNGSLGGASWFFWNKFVDGVEVSNGRGDVNLDLVALDACVEICDPAVGEPLPETCDGRDNDCDGVADEGFELGEVCVEGEGACGAIGETVCNDTGDGVMCDAEPAAPADETCDNVDNDCDGNADEGLGLGERCDEGEGACAAAGETVCGDNGDVICSAEPGQPADETCDALDNDCDAASDEGLGLGEPCSVGVGACAADGENICDGNGGVTCSAEPVEPGVETCDGVDNDCDGNIDEGFGLGDACNEGQGACAAVGTVICDGNGGATCDAEPAQPGAELCDDMDNDCDGFTDEGFGVGERCTAGQGVCRNVGERVCDANGGVLCDAEAGAPSDELCDEEDNDCDGLIDEDFDLDGDCSVGLGECRRDGQRICGEDDVVAGLGGNLVLNGSFENPELNRDWAVFQEIQGWTTIAGNGIEVQRISDAADGNQYVELDSHPTPGGGCMMQQIPVDIGGIYRLSISHSARPNVNDNRVALYWDGVEVAELDADGRGMNNTQWTRYGYDVTGNSNTGTLVICDVTNDRDTLGGFVDNVTIEMVEGIMCDADPGEPVDERCDALDNDCDGYVDEDLGIGDECQVGVGACANIGARQCDENGDVICAGRAGEPVDEACDNVDNDCDGRVDEGACEQEPPCEDEAPGTRIYNVTAWDADQYALYLPNWNEQGHRTDMLFRDGATFTVRPDGTASLTGTAFVNNLGGGAGQLNEEWAVSMSFELRGTGAAHGGPYRERPAVQPPEVTDLWTYYNLTGGTFTHGDVVATLAQYPENGNFPFQLGQWANGRSDTFGASNWYRWTRNNADGSVTSSIGDMNINLDELCVSPEVDPCEAAPAGSTVYQVNAWDAEEYALYLPHWNTEGHRTDMLFRDGATLTVNADGSAALRGTAFVNNLGGGGGQLGEEWVIEMNFERRGTGPDHGGPYRERPEVQPGEVTDLWTYFNLTGGTFRNGDVIATLAQYPENGRFPFQMGQWANGRADTFGASNWYRWTRNNADGSVSTNIGDMNINLAALCEDECEPQDEVCNQADDDCDGEIDEGLDCAGAPVCPQVAVLDFETDAEGQAINAGRDLTDAYAGYGAHLTTFGRGGDGSLGIAFDSANPTGGDPDLGTPNQAFGGPGRGNGGAQGREGENANALGNLLIRAENTVDNNNDGYVDVPDDHGQGARFDYTFDNNVCVYGVDLVDIEDNERGATIEFFDANGALIQTVRGGGLGNNSYERVETDVCGVRKMRTTLRGSGAIDNIEFCVDPNVEPPLCEAGEAFAVNEYAANGHAFHLPNFDGDGRLVRMHLKDDALFRIVGDSGHLTGTAFRTDNDDMYTVDIRFDYRGQGPQFGGPKIERAQWQTADVTDLWRYFDMAEATLMHDGLDVITLTQMPADGRYPLQVGMTANGKNQGLGMASWFFWVRENPNGRTNGTGDINVNLDDVCD